MQSYTGSRLLPRCLRLLSRRLSKLLRSRHQRRSPWTLCASLCSQDPLASVSVQGLVFCRRRHLESRQGVSEGVELGCHDVALQGALALASTCSALRAPCPGHWLQSARRGHWGHWNSRDRVLWRQGPPGGYLSTDRQTDRQALQALRRDATHTLSRACSSGCQ